MKKEYLFGALIILVVALFLVFKSPLLEEKQITQTNQEKENKPVQNKGLGSLCSSEAECQQFCLKNRGQCEQFCRGKAIELCKTLFPPYDNTTSSNPNNKKTCISNPSPVFTHSFVDISKLTEISRYGNSAFNNPGSQVRSYIVVQENESTPIYAPVNLTIKKIYFSDKNYSQFFGREFIRPEYRIDIEVSCEVFIGFDHIISLSDKLKEYAPQTAAPGKNDGVEVSIPVQAGEIIAYSSGGFPGRAFDFLLMNRAREETHLNPSRWTTPHSRYMDCHFKYFPDNLKQQYIALIQEVNGERDCGPSVKEISNTAAGYWFQGNASENSGPRLSIAGAKHFVAWTLIKNNEPAVDYRDHDVRRVLPQTITEGKSACYFDQDRNTHLYLKMLQNDQLSLSTGSGPCPSSFPQNAEIWER